jgi:oligopeptide transport system ATP-binding protein
VGLLKARPTIVDPGEQLADIPGRVPDLLELPPACRFEPRCFLAQPICREDAPEIRKVAPGHCSRCHFAERLEESAA